MSEAYLAILSLVEFRGVQDFGGVRQVVIEPQTTELEVTMRLSHVFRFLGVVSAGAVLSACSANNVSSPGAQAGDSPTAEAAQLTQAQRSALEQRFKDAYLFAISQRSVDTLSLVSFSYAVGAIHSGATPVQVSFDGSAYTMISFGIRKRFTDPANLVKTASFVVALAADDRTFIFGAADDTTSRTVNFSIRDTFVYPNAYAGIDAFGKSSFWMAVTGSMSVSYGAGRGACLPPATPSWAPAGNCALASLTSSLEITDSSPGVNTPRTNAFSTVVPITPNFATASRRFSSVRVVMVGPLYEF